MEDLKMYDGRFMIAICVNRTVVFEVNYGAIEENVKPYFATSSSKFCRNKKDYCQCGQCQKELLTGKAYEFWRKWDKYHLKTLTVNEYDEMINDLKELIKTYPNYVLKNKDYSCHYIHFQEIKNCSMNVKK